MNTSVRISAVIPTYNGAKFIEKTLLSALHQTFTDKEIIVVDDGSTDETPKILEKYKNEITYIRTSNQGVARAMNTGVLSAKGEWISFLDHDDLWFRDKMQKMSDAADRYPSAGMVCCDFISRNPYTRRLMRNYSDYWKIFPKNGAKEVYVEDAFGLMLKGCVMGTSSAVMVRKSLLIDAGLFKPNYRISSDYECWVRCVSRSPVLFLNEVMAYKRTHEGNLSAGVEGLLEYQDIVHGMAVSFGPKLSSPELRRIYASEKARIHYLIGNTYYESSRPLKTFEHYFRGLGCSFSLRNFGTFGWYFLKKLARFLSFGLLSRKRWILKRK